MSEPLSDEALNALLDDEDCIVSSIPRPIKSKYDLFRVIVDDVTNGLELWIWFLLRIDELLDRPARMIELLLVVVLLPVHPLTPPLLRVGRGRGRPKSNSAFLLIGD